MNSRTDPLTLVRRALGRTTEGSVAYRITLERESDADRVAYVQRAESITEGLETSIRDAGSGAFESVAVSRTAGPYSRTMDAIAREEKRVADFNAWLSEFKESGAPWLSSTSAESVQADREEAVRKLEMLYADRQREANTFVYTVSFAPKSSRTVEAIASEFDRLSEIDGVEAVEIDSETPDGDPRNSIDFRAQEERDR